MNMIEHWRGISATLNAADARLLAVSKYTTDEAVMMLAEAGQVDFAESRPQQLRDRAQQFPQLTWHFIGPLQKNKAKYIARYADMWHSLSDWETAQAVAKYRQGTPLPCLIQVNVSGEVQKQGVAVADASDLCAQLMQLPELEVIGVMGMAAKGADARVAFCTLRQLRDDLQQQHGSVRQLCMGMSGDWKIALEEGATMVRLGSTLFSEYPKI